MKSFLTAIFILGLLSSVPAQILYQQDFEDGFQGMTLIDNDGNTPVSQLSSFTAAWNVRGDLLGNAAVSISWYDPAGQSDDWMITPTISGITEKTVLEWDARAFEVSIPENYKVLVSVTGTDMGDFTDQIFIIDGEQTDGTYNHHYILLDQYVGKNIHIAFVNISNNRYIMAVDNIVVRNVRDVDAAFLKVEAATYVRTGTASEVNYTVKNEGFQTIDTMVINWSDGINQFSETLTGLNLGFTEKYEGTFTNSFTATNPDEYPLTFSIVSVGAKPDEKAGNNTAATTVVGVTTVSPRRLVAEEGTGTWCGWCPRGAVFMEKMHQTYPDLFIPIAVHNGPDDPMKNAEYDSGVGNFPDFPGYPSVIMDRRIIVNPIDMESVMQQLLDEVTPVDVAVNATIDSLNRKINIEGKIITYANRSTAKHRLVLVVAENDVRGTSSGYRQVNYYSGGGQGAMGGFENLPNPVPASQMRYDFVGRELLYGFRGKSGIVPAVYHENDEFGFSDTWSIPAAYDLDQLYVVAMVVDSANGVVLNAAKSGPATSTTQENINELASLKIYPNPTRGATNLEMELTETATVTVELVNLPGQTIRMQDYGQLPAGPAVLPVNLSGIPAGIYLAKVNIAGKSLLRKLTVE